MNKKRILFFIYGVIIFITIAVGLVLMNLLNLENNKENAKNSNINANDTENIVTKEEPKFAKKLTINCARTITVQKGREVELLSNYIKIEPSEVFCKLTYEVLDSNGEITKKLIFKNNKIISNDIGKYEIIFKIPKSEKEYLTDNIKINVVNEDNNNFVTTKISHLIFGNSYSVAEIFSVPTFATNLKINGQIIYIQNGAILPTKVGSGDVYVSYESNFLKYNFICNFVVWPKTEYTIQILNVEGSTINKLCNIGDEIVLNYQINYGEKQHINQSIKIETDTSFIYYEITEPIIKIRCLRKGSVKFKIICADDNSVFKELIINFI